MRPTVEGLQKPEVFIEEKEIVFFLHAEAGLIKSGVPGMFVACVCLVRFGPTEYRPVCLVHIKQAHAQRIYFAGVIENIGGSVD